MNTQPISASDLFYVELLLFACIVVMLRNRKIAHWSLALVFVFGFELAMTPFGTAVAWVINTLFHVFF